MYFTLYINLGQSHWVCVDIVTKPCQMNIRLMDSFGDTFELNDYTALQIASLVKTDRSQIVIHKLPAQTQSGVHDCGLFAIAYAMEACLGNLLGSTTAFEQNDMRDHLIACLDSDQITPFPKLDGNVKNCTAQVKRFKVHCICRLPEFYDTIMIQCDHCFQWFHFKCINESETEDEWNCFYCR